MGNLDEKITRIFNDIPEVRAMLENITPSQVSYRYYSKKGSKDRFFWTTKKINHKGNPRYVSGIYRYLKSKNMFKLVNTAGFAKKKKAKVRSLKLSEE